MQAFSRCFCCCRKIHSRSCNLLVEEFEHSFHVKKWMVDVFPSLYDIDSNVINIEHEHEIKHARDFAQFIIYY